jgi:arylsulfatase A-like enzyme
MANGKCLVIGMGLGALGLAAACSDEASEAQPSQASDQAPSPGGGDSSQVEKGSDRPRSVAFYLMDTCRNDRLGYGGYTRQTTPFLTWLAERSVVFEACYSQADWTKPAMASMLSSQYPSTTGVYKMDHRLPDDSLTWPEVLQAAGTTTAGFSANIVMGNTLSNFAQGFDHFTESTLVNQGDPIRFASGSAEKLNRHAFQWLDRNQEWPLLLYMHAVDPHENYEPEARYLERFADPKRDPQFRKEWDQLLQSRPPIPGLFVTQENFDRTGIDSSEFIEHSSNLYDADILAGDDQLQVLWDKLQEGGWGEDMVFVFTSDHGEEFFDHGGTCHGYSLYDEMLRVPLMIYAPGLLPAGKRIETPVRSLDIYPTLCELLNIEIPAGLEGRSLIPLIHGQKDVAAKDVFSEHREDPVVRMLGQGSGVMVSIRSGKWKFISNQVGSQMLQKPRFELYDLHADPKEQSNLADQQPELVQEFEVKVQRYIAKQWNAADLAGAAEMAPEVADELRALGYLGDEDAEDADDVEKNSGLEFWEALRAEDLKRVQEFLGAGTSPGLLEPSLGIQPLSMAAMQGNLELVGLLIEAGAEVDARNGDGATPLLGAAFLGRIEVFGMLLDQGADPKLQNYNGDTVASVSRTPWGMTKGLSDFLGISVEQEAVASGRKDCLELLGSD